LASKLTKSEVGALVAIDAEYWKAKAALESAKERRAALLQKHAAKLPAGEWVAVSGHLLRRSVRQQGERFALKAFTEAGNKVTKAMQAFISRGEPYEILDVKASK
jgi:hypothetical protein